MTEKHFLGIPVEFPYQQPYQAQVALMAKAMTGFKKQENAILESPTGTGKSLALLSSSLAFQKYWKQSQSNSDPSLDVSKSEHPKHMKIWYTSRTHTQLAQLVKELRKLKYIPSMAILASRSQTCINKQVLQNSKDDIDRVCQHLHKDPINQCVYERSPKNNTIPPEFLKANCTDERYLKFDIEDLKDYCREAVLCPYLIAKNLAKRADIIFAPYNYIIDPSLRKQMSINVNGDIVIIDEAHNIESSCRDAATLNLRFEEITNGLQWSTLTPQQEIQYSKLCEPYKSIHLLFEQFEHFVVKKREEYVLARPNDPFIKAEDTKSYLTIIKQLDEISHLAYKTILQIDKENTSNDQFRMPHEAFVVLLNNVFRPLKIIMSNSPNFEDYRLVYQYNENPDLDQIRILCMNPGVAFSSLASKAHNIILTSGTLSPISNIATELGTPFPIGLSAPHVIDPTQVQVYSIGASIKGDALCSAHRDMKASGDKTYLALGEILLKLLPHIPDGALFFMPSYGMMNNMLKTWKNKNYNMYAEIEKIKKIFYESPGAQTQNTFKKYTDHIRSSNGKGALFLAVCRGKMSEGMDFSDQQARAVFVFGIPYPAFKEADIVLKREYNDHKFHTESFGQSLIDLPRGDIKTYASGSEWYTTQAYRSLFQAIGRCIRHKDDYGSIILLDRRFEDEVLSQFPKWVQMSKQKNTNFDDISQKLRKFYGEMRLRFPPKEEIPFNLGSPSTDVPFDLSCTDCTAILFKSVMINPTSTNLMESKGYLSVIKQTKPLFIYILKNNDAKVADACFEQSQWCQEEEIAYKLIKCNKCDAIIGAQLSSGPFEKKDLTGSYLISIDRLNASQKGISVPLNKIVQKPKVLTLKATDLGNSKQTTLSFQ